MRLLAGSIRLFHRNLKRISPPLEIYQDFGRYKYIFNLLLQHQDLIMSLFPLIAGLLTIISTQIFMRQIPSLLKHPSLPNRLKYLF